MENSRVIALAGLILGFISCVAALLVVPEARCAIGLDPSLVAQGTRCKARPAASPSIVTTWKSGGGSPPASVSAEARVAHIRGRFQGVEQGVEAGLYGSVRKDISGIGGDSAYATIYVGDGEIPKIRARIYSGGLKTSVQAYYEGGELLFVYRTVSQMLPTGPREIEQQRYYFGDGGMIRWLDAGHFPVPPGSPAFRAAEAQMSRLGATLLQGARSSDPTIAL